MLSVFCKFRRNNLQRITTREQLQAAFFCPQHPSGRDSKWSAWTEPKKHRTRYTPVQKATSVGLATGKSQVHGGTRLVDKVNKLVIRTWGFLFHTFSLERVGYLCIHPW